ncbi:Glutathione S-transferase, C-terminal [Dillenia turbinata]|uniref:glutathione transferase n=1 Tax=Dillenia turbinata TaxID=194707 RepID=A0AAN8ZMH5_9MAGN
MEAKKKLYGAVDSPSTMRALASLLEHQVEFEFTLIDLEAGEHKKEVFLSLSPFGEIPVFQDGDLTLFESRTIMRYISHAYAVPGKDHIFEEPNLQGIVAGWIDIEDHQFDPPASRLLHEILHKPSIGLSTDVAVVVEEEAKLAKVLDVYEERLGKRKFLGGNKFTSADLTHLPNLHLLTRTRVKELFETRPCVYAWCTGIMSRPAWTKVVDLIERSKSQA